MAEFSWTDKRTGSVLSTGTEGGVSSFSTNAPASIDAPGNGFLPYVYEVFASLRGCNSDTTIFDVMIGGSPELGIELQELGIEGNLGVTEASNQICVGGVAGELANREYVSQPFGFSVERSQVVSAGGSASVEVVRQGEEASLPSVALGSTAREGGIVEFSSVVGTSPVRDSISFDPYRAILGEADPEFSDLADLAEEEGAEYIYDIVYEYENVFSRGVKQISCPSSVVYTLTVNPLSPLDFTITDAGNDPLDRVSSKGEVRRVPNRLEEVFVCGNAANIVFENAETGFSSKVFLFYNDNDDNATAVSTEAPMVSVDMAEAHRKRFFVKKYNICGCDPFEKEEE